VSLRIYNRKRNFSKTPEPKGKEILKKQGHPRFVVQLHHASRLHYDVRLEFGGVFKSWAVPKGPSLNPQDQRLAVFVEDHPLDYGSFEGIIPEKNYGAGTVVLWDEGTYLERNSKDRKETEAAMKKGLAKGHLTFILEGKKLKGEFALIKLKKNEGEKAWLLVKKRDEYSTYKRNILSDASVKTGRSATQIAKESEKKGDIWLSKKNKPDSIKPAPSKKISQDPMPRKIKPMLATLSHKPLKGNHWILEDSGKGLRAIAEVEGKRVHLYSKAGLSFDKKYPEIIEDLKTLNTIAVFDGEVLLEKKKPLYTIFDILYFDKKDLRKEPLKKRKEILEKLGFKGQLQLAKNSEKLKTPYIAKNLESAYHSGTSSDWLVVEKTITEQEAQLTHLDKIFWPADGITKGDLLNYYKQIAPFILPYLKDRPESLNRHPDGITGPGFYQKDMTGYLPRWFKTEMIYSESTDKSIHYALCQDERSLLYIVNLGCIEINPWFSRVGHLEKPDFLVIDLDPDGNDFDHVIEIAHEFHKILDSIGAANYCKTSGATGIHIGVPTGAKYDFDTVRGFAENVCKIVCKKYPATTSLDRNPNRRRKKIYLDYMQNRRGQTLAAPFCVRPKVGAPVSMPLEWKELKKGLRPEDFHIKNAAKIIQKKEDSWKGVLGKAIDLKKCLEKLKKL
jgi:bifunctional non-homologous end joining protein LigD